MDHSSIFRAPTQVLCVQGCFNNYRCFVKEVFSGVQNFKLSVQYTVADLHSRGIKTECAYSFLSFVGLTFCCTANELYSAVSL